MTGTNALKCLQVSCDRLKETHDQLQQLQDQILPSTLAQEFTGSAGTLPQRIPVLTSQKKTNEILNQIVLELASPLSIDVRYAADKTAMRAASRYWTLVRIDASGQRKVEEIASLKAFFLESFPEFMAQSGVPGILVERQLLAWMRESGENDVRGEKDVNRRFLAERCLQCFISSQIERVCLQLEAHFGAEHGFTCSDLLSFVLDDDGKRQGKDTKTPVSTSYQSLQREILQSFDPDRSSLATWTTRRVKHHKELNAFLLEHGVYLLSDWAILNDTRPKQLQRIFSQFYLLTSVEIQQATRLLESYHAVYRAQRLLARRAGNRGHCLPPTMEQLQQIAQRLSTQITQKFSPETLRTQLQKIASRLREYRIAVRSGSLPTESLDAKVPGALTDNIPSLELVDNRDTQDKETEFLSVYRREFLSCLDQAIAQVIEERVRTLQRQDPQKARTFLNALQLFYCQKRAMTEIAPLVNLKAQFQVSRLLKLKSFRADIQQQLLVQLRYRVIEEAKAYTSSERLQALSQQIEEAIGEQVSEVIQEAATEAATSTRNQSLTSLFAKRLCLYLDTRSSDKDSDKNNIKLERTRLN